MEALNRYKGGTPITGVAQMPVTARYSVIQGNGNDINRQVSQLATDGWKPILMSSTVNSFSATAQIQIVIVLELIE
jgi:hypothetical protein